MKKFLNLILSFILLILLDIQFNVLSLRYSYNKNTKLNNKLNTDYIIITRQKTQLSAVNQPFNPFSNRRKNNRVRWHEADLESFYQFVDAQPLLTAQQELKYGKALRMGLQIDKLRETLQLQLNSSTRIDNEVLSKHLCCSLTTVEKMIKYAEISKMKLVNGNMKLVLAIVSRYRSNTVLNSELIAEGVRGLAKAVLRYDYSKGFRFATYATWYVHQAIADYVRIRKHPAKMPSRYLILYRKVKQYSSDYKSTNSRLPTVTEISLALDETLFDVTKVLSMHTSPVYLSNELGGPRQNHKYSDQKSRLLEEIIPSNYKTSLQLSSNIDLKLSLEKLFDSNLNDVEKDILRLRLGLDDGKVKPVKEIGRKFQITWKQVRNFEKNAILKLQSSPDAIEFASSYYAVTR